MQKSTPSVLLLTLISVRSNMRHSSSLTALDSMENSYAAPLVELEPLAAPPNEAAVRARMRAEARASARARPGPSGVRAAPRRAPEPNNAPALATPPAPISALVARGAAGAADGARRGAGSGLPASPSGRLSLDGAMQRVSEEEVLCEPNSAAVGGGDGGTAAHAAVAPVEWDAHGSDTAADVSSGPPAVGKGGEGTATVAVEANAGTADRTGASAPDPISHPDPAPDPGPGPDGQGPGRLLAVLEEADAAASPTTGASGGHRGAHVPRLAPVGSPSGVPEAASSAPAELIPSVAELSSPEGRAKPVRPLTLYVHEG